METSRLKAIQQPTRAAGLLETYASTGNVVPAYAHRVDSPHELTAPLRRLAHRGERGDFVWRAWTDGHRIWFLSAVPSLELARERKKPVLLVRMYDETAELIDVATCVLTADQGWQKCL